MVNARGIAVATNPTIAACFLMFTVVVQSGHGGGLALPVFIGVVVVATAGMVLALRVRGRAQDR